MNNLNIKIRSVAALLYPYRWLLLPIIPLIIFLLFLLSSFMQPTSQPQQPIPVPTKVEENNVPLISPLPTNAWAQTAQDGLAIEWGEDEGEGQSAQFYKKEEQPNGITIYFYASTNPDRPDITIRNSDNSIIFYREQRGDLGLMDLPTIKATFGEPEQIIKEPTYYGSQAEIYFYGSQSFAFIVNPQTNETYEVHFFSPMSPQEYVQRYKNLF